VISLKCRRASEKHICSKLLRWMRACVDHTPQSRRNRAAPYGGQCFLLRDCVDGRELLEELNVRDGVNNRFGW
jgi:hypothetical protein